MSKEPNMHIPVSPLPDFPGVTSADRLQMRLSQLLGLRVLPPRRTPLDDIDPMELMDEGVHLKHIGREPDFDLYEPMNILDAFYRNCEWWARERRSTITPEEAGHQVSRAIDWWDSLERAVVIGLPVKVEMRDPTLEDVRTHLNEGFIIGCDFNRDVAHRGKTVTLPRLLTAIRHGEVAVYSEETSEQYHRWWTWGLFEQYWVPESGITAYRLERT